MFWEYVMRLQKRKFGFYLSLAFQMMAVDQDALVRSRNRKPSVPYAGAWRKPPSGDSGKWRRSSGDSGKWRRS